MNDEQQTTTRRYIDMTPTWREAAQIIALAIEHGTDEGKAAAKSELFRMAEMLDNIKAEQDNSQ